MTRLHYRLVDVFTDRAFGGNPLAVFVDGRGVSDPIMQSLAKELNLSETTFVLPAQDSTKNDFRVRIFTPVSELPMAGHPTIGTAFVLARERMLNFSNSEVTVIFEEGVGPLPVTIMGSAGLPMFAEMRQPLPEFGPQFEDVRAIAAMLSIEESSIRDTNVPIEVASCGMPFLIVPIGDLETVRRIRLRFDLWEKTLRGFAAEDVFVFTTEVQFEGSDVHCRMFAPGHGISEDPATGGASGPLGCYLVRHNVIGSKGELRCTSEQGVEMGRPSLIKIKIAHQGNEITDVRVGGNCSFMGGGYFDLDVRGSSDG